MFQSCKYIPGQHIHQDITVNTSLADPRFGKNSIFMPKSDHNLNFYKVFLIIFYKKFELTNEF